ncbi:hypothetical protein N7524_011708 [Penicillium chrysogenum]|nr:hypothetical protein N7524_011708 [Penicillium chrysogenum]
MLSSLKAAQEKLSKYYAMIYSIEGDLYESDNPEKDYKRIYRDSLKSLFASYEEKRPEERLRSDVTLIYYLKTRKRRYLRNRTSLRGTLKVRPYEAPLGSFRKTINTSFLYSRALPGILCQSQQLEQEWSVSLTPLGTSVIIDEGL